MSTKLEVKRVFIEKYQGATTKKEKTLILDAFIQATGYNRKYAIVVLNHTPSIKERREKDMNKLARKYTGNSKKFSDKTIRCLEIIYEASDFQNSKALVAQMDMWIKKGKKFGWLSIDEETEKQLRQISHGSIDNHLKMYRKANGLRGISTTKPGSLLRNSLEIRKAGDKMEQIPGFIEGDTVAHCGNELKGEFIRTLTTTDVFTGWSENIAISNNSHANITEGLLLLECRYPFKIKGYDFDNGSEFMNYDVIQMISARDIYLTRSRPYRKNDNAHVEQKNNDIVRRNVVYYRYDNKEEQDIMNEIYKLNHYKFNFFTPTKKAIGYKEQKDKLGRKVRIYDAPQTPLDRVLKSGVLSKKQERAFKKERDELDPRDLVMQMNVLRRKLYELGSQKPESQDRFLPLHKRRKCGIL
jgi:hypothetical protein